TTAQFQLLGAGAASRQPCLELTLPAVFVLAALAQLLTLRLQVALLPAQRLELLLVLLQLRGQFQLFLAHALDFLAPGQDAPLVLAPPATPRAMPADPVALAADQALAVARLLAQRQRLLQALHRPDLAKPGRQVGAPLDLVQQAARPPRALFARQQ